MPGPSTHTSLALVLTVVIAPGALAGTAVVDEAAEGKNIFSSAAERNTIPSFTEVRGGEGKLRKLLLGNAKDGIPDFKQVLMLPSLSPDQRRDLRERFKSNKAQGQEILNKLRVLKEKHDTAGGVAANTQEREQFLQLRSSLQQLRKRTWEEMQSQLSSDQLKELDAMRHGELQPATFRGEMSGEMSNGR